MRDDLLQLLLRGKGYLHSLWLLRSWRKDKEREREREKDKEEEKKVREAKRKRQ